MGFSILI
jgi:NAD(P)-dependent dehydrogenase (short-subunit alcohol dehydrogenase family)